MPLLSIADKEVGRPSSSAAPSVYEEVIVNSIKTWGFIGFSIWLFFNGSSTSPSANGLEKRDPSGLLFFNVTNYCLIFMVSEQSLGALDQVTMRSETWLGVTAQSLSVV